MLGALVTTTRLAVFAHNENNTIIIKYILLGLYVSCTENGLEGVEFSRNYVWFSCRYFAAVLTLWKSNALETIYQNGMRIYCYSKYEVFE